MSVELLDLPKWWLAHLVQHVASGPGGLVSAARLSQACKLFRDLSKDSAVTYRNLHVDRPLFSLHPLFWSWLEEKHERVAGFTAEVPLPLLQNFCCNPSNATVAVPEHKAKQLRVLFNIPDLRLTLRSDHEISNSDDTLMTKVLGPHGHLIGHLSVRINGDMLRLQDFCEAATRCRSLDLTVVSRVLSHELVNLSDLHPVAGSLVQFCWKDAALGAWYPRSLEGVNSLSLLSQLTSLSLDNIDFRDEEPWIHLAALTNLKQLSLRGAALGDPSALSALTGLSSLKIHSSQVGYLLPCTFTSLQPLSTMHQLKELALLDQACSATCLHGLSGLSSLETLKLNAPKLKCLSEVSTGLTSLTIKGALWSWDGIEELQSLRHLCVWRISHRSLRRIVALGNLEQLSLIDGTFTSLTGLQGNMRTSLHSLTLEGCYRLVSLWGIEGFSALEQLKISDCKVISLQPVERLVGGLEALRVYDCRRVQGEVLELPYIQPRAIVRIARSKVKEVVLAGGVRKRVDGDDFILDGTEEMVI